MQHLCEEDYSAQSLSAMLQLEANSAVEYIQSVIEDYEGKGRASEHFSDVIMFEASSYEQNPRGAQRRATRGRHGIYVFVSKDDFHLTKDQVKDYNRVCAGAKFKISREIDIKKGQHFYQGSATGNSLQVRLKDHFSEFSQVSALQLNHTSRIVVKDHLRLFVFPVIRALDRHPFFIRMIEKNLHERFPSITGGTRT